MERKEATCMAEDYGDILLKAVKTVVDGVVEGLQFDKTVICKITNNTKADKGEYTVNDGSSTFLAYTDNPESYWAICICYNSKW